jgi:mono/diheme cytochrome c family protein
MLRPLCWVAALCLAATMSLRIVAAQTAAGRTVWDGAYTEAQAARGALAFNQSCANCHATGEDGTRPVTGDKFWQAFTQKTVGDMLSFLKTSMPNNSPGSLPGATYNDLAAFILKANGFPTGAAEVTPETVAGIQIIPRDGPGELPANTLARIVGCLAPRSGSDWVLTNATAPERVDKGGIGSEDATRQLGDRTATLKFVIGRLDTFVGKRMSVTGLLIGAGGRDGINVTNVARVAETCP